MQVNDVDSYLLVVKGYQTWNPVDCGCKWAVQPLLSTRYSMGLKVDIKKNTPQSRIGFLSTQPIWDHEIHMFGNTSETGRKT